MTIWAVVPASGTGRRMGSGTPKQYLTLADRSILEHTLSRLLEIPDIERITVVTSGQDAWWDSLNISSHPRIVREEGASVRYLSVLNGVSSLQSVAKSADWVLVHDAARPCVRIADIKKLIEELADHEVGGLLGVPVSNTLKKLDKDNTVLETVDRTDLWQAITPQLFRFALLAEALGLARANNVTVTDEASAVELLGHKPQMVEGCADNIKITQHIDLELAQHIMKSQAAEQ